MFYSNTDLHQILAQLNMLPAIEEGQESTQNKEFLLELLVRIFLCTFSLAVFRENPSYCYSLGVVQNFNIL